MIYSRSKVHEMRLPRTRINIQQLLEVQNAEILTAAYVIYRQLLDVRARPSENPTGAKNWAAGHS
jgi:hypothetical protein